MRHGALYTRLIQSKEWRELRAQVMTEQKGLCRWCYEKGYIVPATEVHHIIECESGKTDADVRRLMFSRSNVVALCHKCHSDYHKAQRYHSTEVVKQRQAERFNQWKDEMSNRFK